MTDQPSHTTDDEAREMDEREARADARAEIREARAAAEWRRMDARDYAGPHWPWR